MSMFCLLFIIATTTLALPLQQKRKRMGRSMKAFCGLPTESNGTPAMDLGLGTNHVRRYRVMCV